MIIILLVFWATQASLAMEPDLAVVKYDELCKIFDMDPIAIESDTSKLEPASSNSSYSIDSNNVLENDRKLFWNNWEQNLSLEQIDPGIQDLLQVTSQPKLLFKLIALKNRYKNYSIQLV